MLIKHSIVFDLEKRKENEIHPIRMRVSYSGYPRIDFKVGFSVKENEFDKLNEKATARKALKKHRRNAGSMADW